MKQREKVRRGEWLWKEVQRTRKKRSPVQSLCPVQPRPSLTTVRLKVPANDKWLQALSHRCQRAVSDVRSNDFSQYYLN